MALAFQRLLIFIPTEDVFVELHVGAAEGLEEIPHLLRVVHHFLGEVVGIDIDADGAHDAVFLPDDRDRGAFEFPGADVRSGRSSRYSPHKLDLNALSIRASMAR